MVITGSPSINVGGTEARAGWLSISNDVSYGHVDVVADARALPFKTASVECVYSSHMLEHLPYAGGFEALGEWRRVLRSGGSLLLGVPDVERIAQHFGSDPEVAFQMLYGGQDKDWNVHQSGYSFTKLVRCLTSRGFGNIERVNVFGIFNDWTCRSFIAGVNMSLNVKAVAQ